MGKLGGDWGWQKREIEIKGSDVRAGLVLLVTGMIFCTSDVHLHKML